MTFALATAVTLSFAWMLFVLAASVIEQSGAKILAALKGYDPAPELTVAPVRVRSRMRSDRPLRATPRLRAAA